MQNGPGRFELTLNLQEVVVLFLVMIALFAGLLFFGYRVGYTQSASAIQLESTPLAPAQENPQVEKQAPAVEAEPEIRLENSPAKPGDQPFGHAEPGHPGPPGQEPLARLLGDRTRRPCKADSYLSFLQKTLPAKYRSSEDCTLPEHPRASRSVAC